MNTPPSPKKEFVEMAREITHELFYLPKMEEIAPRIFDAAFKALQSIDAKAREEKAEEAEKLFDAYHQVLQSESTPEDYDELKSLLKKWRSRHPKPEEKS